jgi:alkylation response protein AidB-like acyl-CoA dehydrogenase
MTDFSLAPEIEALRDAAARFAARELAPAARDSEAAGCWPNAVLRVLDGFSLGSLDLPEALGGAGLGTLAKVVALEALAMGDPGGLPAADQPGMAAGALIACPDDAAAAEVAAACASRAAHCALVVVEPDVAARPRLEWTPSWPPLRWVWTIEGDALALLAVDGDLEDRSALAFHASGGGGGELDDARVLGHWTLPGAGPQVRGRARLWAAAIALGVAQAALDATVTYTAERVVFGRPVLHHQGNAFELAGAATHLHAARLMVQDAARRFDEGDTGAGYWATQASLTALDAAGVVTDLGIQLLGGHGFLVDHLAEKRFREVGMLRLLVGGRDAAEADLADQVLDVPESIFVW